MSTKKNDDLKENNDNSRKEREKNEKRKKLLLGTLIIILIAILATIVIYSFVKQDKDEGKLKENEIGYTDLIKQIDDGNIEKVKMTVGSTSVKVTLKGEDKPKNCIVPNTQAFIELIQEKVQEGNDINLIQEKANVFLSIFNNLFSFLPTILMAILFILVLQMEGLGDKGKVYDAEEQDVKTTFDDVAGLDEEKQEMIEIVKFLKNPDEFYKMGAKIPRGVLLCGEPGTGKTLIAKAIAGEADVPFISMSGSEFTEMFAGLGASRVRKLFEKAKKMSPAIIFIDEIDAIGSKRSDGGTAADTDNNQTLNQLLVEMDGFDSEHTVILLAATNRPEMLDRALLRPGRFDRHIKVDLPNEDARLSIFKVHTEGMPLADDVSLEKLAKQTDGYVGADIEAVCREADMLTLRTNLDAENAT